MTAHHPSTPPPPSVTVAACESCQRQFVRDAPWKRLCLDCWRTDARRRQAQAQAQAPSWTPQLQAERDRLAVEVADLRARLEAVTRQRDERVKAYQTVADALVQTQRELLALRVSTRSAAPTIGADLIDRLIRLCHPDRHPEGRQAEATSATQALLQMRERLRGGA